MNEVRVSELTLSIDFETAWALANLLMDSSIEKSMSCNMRQQKMLSALGAGLGLKIDHESKNNSKFEKS